MLAVAALTTLGLAACGGGGSNNDTTAAATPTNTAPAGGGTTGGGGGGGGASTVSISTPSGSSLAYNQKSATAAKPGNVTIDFDNMQALQHDVTVADSSGKVLGATNLVSSGTATTTVSLTAGTYTFYCSVPGHREAGMQGTLTVK
jgi:plastocyanin